MIDKKIAGLTWLALFVASIPTANWMIGNVGACGLDGPCVIPVGFGLYAPSGVLMIGLALVARDEVHEAFGWRMSALAIFAGSTISFVVADPFIALASVSSFLLSELSDLAAYSKLRQKSRSLAILGSGVVGAIVDSAVFLFVAFGNLNFLAGQVIGKLFWSVIAAAFRATSIRPKARP